MRSILAAALAAVAVLTCTTVPEAPSRTSPDRYFDPPEPARVRTTGGAIYLGNLQARIDLLTGRLETRPSPALRTELAEQLLLRFRIFSSLQDLERADRLAGEALAARCDPASLLLAARIDAALHRFDAALERLTGLDDVPAARTLRREILLATGRPQAGPAGRPTVQSLAAAAEEQLDRGRLDLAMAGFHRALAAYAGADPYPLAWLLTRIGIAYLRFDRPADARAFFEAALARLPGYVAAKDHLAEALVAAGDIAAAVPLYQELIETTGDPEFCGVLAGLYPPRSIERRRLERCATQGFVRALENHRAAFLFHAAEYHLERGRTLEALRLASRNLEIRQDVGSRMLAARAAFAHGHRKAACDIVAEIREDGYAPPELAKLDC